MFAGVDYGAILVRAEAEADVIVWDGGNNDLPFYRPTLHFCLVDPHRAGDESSYHPGETNLRMADAVVITKEDTAPAGSIEAVRAAARALAPRARIVDMRLPITVDDATAVRGRRVLAVDDGPTLTHAACRPARPSLPPGVLAPRWSIPGRMRTEASVMSSRGIRRSDPCCRRWATARRRSASWKRQSTLRPATSCWSVRRSTSGGRCTCGMRSSARGTRPRTAGRSR